MARSRVRLQALRQCRDVGLYVDGIGLGRQAIDPTGGLRIQVPPAVESQVCIQAPVQIPKAVLLVGFRCCWLGPAGRLAAGGPIRPCPAEVSCAGGVLPSCPSPCRGLSLPQSTMHDKTPQEHAAGGPGDETSPLAWPGCHRRAQVPAWFRVRVSPSVPQELYTIRLWCPPPRSVWGFPQCLCASLPACHGLRTPADLHILANTEARVWPSGA